MDEYRQLNLFSDYKPPIKTSYSTEVSPKNLTDQSIDLVKDGKIISHIIGFKNQINKFT